MKIREKMKHAEENQREKRTDANENETERNMLKKITEKDRH